VLVTPPASACKEKTVSGSVQIGNRYHRLIVIKESPLDHNYQRHYLVRCDCGKEKIVTHSALASGQTKSCGCFQVEYMTERGFRHGECTRRLYNIWKLMRSRCSLETASGYMDYGGRGISVCEDWHDYITFSEWADSNGYGPNKCIDRIDNDGNYNPENCQWITKEENSRKVMVAYNKRRKELKHGRTPPR